MAKKKLNLNEYYKDLPPNKTVWGLTREEIETCAYLYQTMSIMVLVIGLIDVFTSIHSEGQYLLLPIILFMLTIIPIAIGFYGVCKENIYALYLYLAFNVLAIIVYALAVYLSYWPICETVIMVILCFQLIISTLLVVMMVQHNEIFKKEFAVSSETSEKSAVQLKSQTSDTLNTVN